MYYISLISSNIYKKEVQPICVDILVFYRKNITNKMAESICYMIKVPSKFLSSEYLNTLYPENLVLRLMVKHIILGIALKYDSVRHPFENPQRNESKIHSYFMVVHYYYFSFSGDHHRY